MGMIVNEIVRHAMAHPFEQHGWNVAFRPAAFSLEMAILDEVSAGCERLPVATLQRHSAVPRIRDLAVQHGVAKSAAHTDTVVADEPKHATGDTIASAAFDLHSIAARGFENQSLKRHV